MPLEDIVGRTIGTYRIESPLGAGGMGEVYRAHDTKLDRPVAVKFLGRRSSRAAEDVERFRAEALTISSLNHPHIVVIHDAGEVDGQPFIVTELVEGMTLRTRLLRNDVTVREAIDIGRQVASALAAAHSRNVIHRDIKPENIMVRPDGYVKVLDFGLAKLTDRPSAPPEAATLRSDDSLIVGTPEYMSPEQAAGRTVGFATDQFSLGVVLYELVTGQNPFRRPSRVQTAAAVIADEPAPVARLCPDIPPPLRWTIERCLAKRASDRYSSTDDLQRELATVHDRISDLRQPVAMPPSNLPIPSTRLVGREAEATSLHALLSSSDVRWITVTGPGGVGKTRLTLHVGREMSPQFAHVYFVPLANVTDAALVASIVAQALDVRATGGESALAAIHRLLRSVDRPVLVVIDNFEHVTGAAVAVSELLEHSEHLKILVTSRSRLNVSAEHEYQLAPLALPTRREASHVTSLEQTAAVSLFVERARAARASFALTPDNAAAIVDICVALDGLPLAIELAAARVKMLTPQALLARIADKRLSLSGGARDLPSRQQTLRATIEWGYELLDPAEQKLFQRLAVFVGGWSLESAEAVCDAGQDLGIDLFDGISSLVDKSLVQALQSDDEGRFAMLRTIREYALERLASSGHEPVTRRAHAAYALILAEEGASGDALARVKWLHACDAEHPNLRASIDYLLETRQTEWALRLGAALVPFWEARAHLAEGRDRLARILAIATDSKFRALRLRVEFLLGTLMNSMGNSDGAADVLINRVLPGYRELGDQHGMAATLNAIGISRRALGQLADARDALEESLAIWREIGNPTAIARSLVNLGSVSLEEGRGEEAIRLYRDARRTSEESGDQVGAAWAANFEAQVEHAVGDEAAAEALLAQALQRFRVLSDGWGEADSLLMLGLIAGESGRAAESLQLFAEAHRVSQRIGDILGTARLIEAAARLAVRAGQSDRALTLAGAAAALRQSLNAPLGRIQRESLDRALEEARRQLDARQAGASWMRGWSLPPEEATALALRAEA